MHGFASALRLLVGRQASLAVTPKQHRVEQNFTKSLLYCIHSARFCASICEWLDAILELTCGFKLLLSQQNLTGNDGPGTPARLTQWINEGVWLWHWKSVTLKCTYGWLFAPEPWKGWHFWHAGRTIRIINVLRNMKVIGLWCSNPFHSFHVVPAN